MEIKKTCNICKSDFPDLLGDPEGLEPDILRMYDCEIRLCDDCLCAVTKWIKSDESKKYCARGGFTDSEIDTYE